MDNNNKVTEVLNDLIQINNDRIEGYKRAIKEADDSDADLKAIFHRMEDESRQYLAELTREVVKSGGEPVTGTTASGKIYRAWMDVKATFTGSDRETLLSNCEYGEDAAQKAYQQALNTDETLPVDIRQLIANQKSSLKISHDTIKKFRDMYKDSDTNNDALVTSGSAASSNSISGSGSMKGTGSVTNSDDFTSDASRSSNTNNL
jgi:uncharacterized protein (TIGR02284 family)